jgi:DNA-binding transcriptional LysR family regulator
MQASRLSLNALRAFEATARLRSMSSAADELCVTHGAVSRHIRSLEETLGVVLLNRGPRSTDPTPEGMRLADDLSTAFSLIQASVEQIQPGPLTLSCSSSIMMYWLIPRMARFNALHPDIKLQFNMNYDQVDFVRDKIGVAIRNSTIQPPKEAEIRELMIESIGPVCSPEYMRSTRLKSPADLAGAHLLSTKTRSSAWLDWVNASGYTGPPLEARESYDHFYLLIQAAACGLGVATVPRMLVLDDLRSGKLVAPFGFVPGPRTLVLWVAPHLAARYETRVLTAWLDEELRASEADDAIAAVRSNGAQRQVRQKV